jgi:hypothetical protein
MRSILPTLSAAALVGVLSVANARAQSFEEGTNVLGVGVGVLGGYSIGFSGSGVSQSPAFLAFFDHGMGDLGPGQWGLGGYVGYKTISYKENYLNYYNYDYRYTFLVVGARGTWHYNEWHGNDKLDTYGGIMLAYRSISWKDETNYGQYGNLNNYTYSGSGVGFSGFLGARYKFTDKVGGFAELGYGITTLQLGVAFEL